MREIKFRGKSLSDGKWRYLTVAPYAENTLRIVSECDEYEIIDMDTLCQYTGLNDKNGVEIYEGDICVITVGNIGEEDGYFAARWDNEGAQYILDGDGLAVDFDSVYSYECEVIGNIWDNKELLEAEE